jgi:hypothetical protein
MLVFVLSVASVLGTVPEGAVLAEDQPQSLVTGQGHSEPAPVIMKKPLLQMAEGSNKCEIVSCGMGIKDTCQIDCPEDKTPKCSCDCIRNIGPLCMEYKANCRCE